MKLHSVVLAAVAAALLVPNTASADDAEIAKELSAQLRQAQAAGQLEQFRLGVKVEDGTVWLKGSVADDAQRDLALDHARRITGVRLVINDISVGPVAASAEAAPVSHVAESAHEPTPAVPGSVMAIPRGEGTHPAGGPRPIPASGPVPVARAANFAQAAGGYHEAAGLSPVMMPAAYGGGAYYGGPIAGDSGFAYDAGYAGEMGQPMPVQGYGYEAQGGVRYEQPQMPGYAWPSYAAHPNYAAVTYPKQYSPMAWPYIGPFYPYPQVPLGWRKVTLEWDDGWWMLDFKSK